jgi:hypothetical protein
MKCITFIRTNKVQEATDLIEMTYRNQVKQLEGDLHHPFLESTLSHLGLIYKVTQKYKQSIETYT